MSRRTPQSGPAVWYGPEMASRGDWLIEFSQDDVSAIEESLRRLKASGRGIEQTRTEDLLRGSWREKAVPVVRDGRGFALLRGLPVERWDRETAAWAYWLVGLQFGSPVPQNGDGHLLGHVKNLGKDHRDPAVRIYQTNYLQPFHIDSCDIVGLLCLSTAKSGGESRIVSSTTLYNEALKRRPDLLEVLFQPFYYDRKNEIPSGKGPYYQISVFHDFGGSITCFYARDFIEAAQRRFPELPRLTEKQREALDLIDSLAEDPAINLSMEFRPGDMQFLHNHQILHARAAYEDWPEPERRRHLLRLWLSTPDGRPLPPVFAERYGTVEPGALRGGIRISGVEPKLPLDVS